MGSLEDLRTLTALNDNEPVVAEGLDDRCLLLDAASEFGEWTDAPARRGVPFARDGSECEFCLLDNGAVVAYGPLADRPHVVVGADLREFLALLLSTNGAGVGALTYDYGRDETVAEIEAGADDEDTPAEKAALGRLTEVFGLTRWSNVGARLRDLESLLPT